MRSILERCIRTEENSGSLRMFFHLPGPCFATPASRPSSSSAVHFCFWFPIIRSFSLSTPSKLSLSPPQSFLFLFPLKAFSFCSLSKALTLSLKQFSREEDDICLSPASRVLSFIWIKPMLEDRCLDGPRHAKLYFAAQ